jgi:hypothetical protein
MSPRALFGVALLAFWPSPARAEGFLITYGETVCRIDGRQDVGYQYYSLGVCGIDLWTWGGTYCRLDAKGRCFEVAPARAAELLNKAPADLREPFVYRCPPGILILLLVVGCLLLRAARRNSAVRKLYALLKERRYLKALAIFHDHAHLPSEDAPAAVSEAITATPSAGTALPAAATEEGRERNRQAAGFHAAPQSLAREGVELDEAGPNLAALLSRPQPADAFSPGGAAVNSQG